MLLGFRWFKLKDGLNFIRNRRNSIWQKDVAKVFSPLCSPSTFLWFDSESSLLEDLENFGTNLKMVFIGAIGEDTDIVKENFDFGLESEKLGHCSLK